MSELIPRLNDETRGTRAKDGTRGVRLTGKHAF